MGTGVGAGVVGEDEGCKEKVNIKCEHMHDTNQQAPIIMIILVERHLLLVLVEGSAKLGLWKVNRSVNLMEP